MNTSLDMKKLVLLLFLVIFSFLPESKASHIAGGEITYEYIGDSTGTPYHYCITLTLYRDNSGFNAGLGSTAILRVNSTCNFNVPNVTMQRVSQGNAGDGGDTISSFFPCVARNDPGLYQLTQHVYKACIILPGKCSDWTFWWSSCCRNGLITNLISPSSRGFYIESTLNNTFTPNTSPVFVNPAAKAFCVSPSPFVWSQNAVEPDLDSLYFRFGHPKEGNYPNPADIPFAAGYGPGFPVNSTLPPMTTANGINVNSSNGTFLFQPTQAENDVIKVVVEEWRLNTNFNIQYKVGSIFRELQVPVVATCNPVATTGISIDSTALDPSGNPVGTALYSVDSLKETFNITEIGNPTFANGQFTRLPVIPYKCFDSIVNVKFTKGLVCDSFSSNASEFRIIGPDEKLRPVTGITLNCGPDLLTRSVDLHLHKSLDTVGDFLLYIKTGDDGNSLMNECGYPVDSFFAIIIRIDQCPYPDYKLNNVSVFRDQDIDIDWEIDINSFVPSAFTAWNILRANENDQFYILTSLNEPGDVNERSFRDTTLESIDVDLSQWQYQVQLVQNGKAYTPSNRIHSILLKDTINNNEDGSIYSWTVYNGWDSAAYELEYGRFDTVNNQMNWTNYDGPQQDYFKDDYIWPTCDNPDTVGLYAFRVIATDPMNANNTFESESNWLYYELKCEEPEPTIETPTKIPTVFTPNGDGSNDVFTITTGMDVADVSIYNRWGKPVYSYSGEAQQVAWDGTDQNSGQKVSDGVYYYIIKLNGETPDGQGGIKSISDEKTGSLTIFTNGTK